MFFSTLGYSELFYNLNKEKESSLVSDGNCMLNDRYNNMKEENKIQKLQTEIQL